MRIIARILSTLFHPLLMPTYGGLLLIRYSMLAFYPLTAKLFILGTIALFTLLIPMIGIILLYGFKVISNVNLNKREDRKIPYMISLVSYFLCGIVLYRLGLPLWLIGFVGGGLLSLVIASLITVKWKISAHLTAMGGVTACAFYLTTTFGMLPLWLLTLMILLTGLLGSSRIILNRHTFGQTLAGTVNGFLCVYLSMLLLG